MVSYCCVNECQNNTKNFQKDAAPPLLFFAFPTNRIQRLKWVYAIGRPNWNPPATARVCSAHFRADQLDDMSSTRVPDHVVPVIGLRQEKVDLGVSALPVCRVCLATDVKMYSIRTGYLRTCFHALAGINDTLEGLPECVCYVCAAILVKSYKLVEKSSITETTLLDLYTRYGSISYSIIQKQDRTALNLKSFLQVENNVTETFEYVNDDEDDTPLIYIKQDALGTPKKEASNVEVFNAENECKFEASSLNEEIDLSADEFDADYNEQHDSNNVENNNHDGNNDTDDNCEDSSNLIEFKNQLDNNIQEETPYITKAAYENTSFNTEDGPRKRNKHKLKTVGEDGLTEDERELDKYFKIVKLTLPEQMEDFKETQKYKFGDFRYECEACARTFSTSTLLKRHMTVHDPSRGAAECPVCKHRYKNTGLLNAHMTNAHGKKFICNSCPKVFRNIGMARKHQLEHAGLVYQCPHCAFTTAFEASLGVHSRFMHAGCSCGRCRRIFVGGTKTKESKDEGKPIDGALKENRFKKPKKRKKPDKCGRKSLNPDSLTTCKLCGVNFPSAADLKAHRRREHAGQYRNKTWFMPGDKYPTQCDHCSTMLSCRKEHWAHVRRSHPDLKGSYRSVITAVCEVCGQGFQNKARLRLHELRHGQPKVPCQQCNKMFYDKFLLAIHMETHSDARPYRCQTCGKGFKTRSNLDKHHRTHSDVAAYTCKLCAKKFKYSTSMNLHIRTVHHKIPLPPRKRKSRKNAPENT